MRTNRWKILLGLAATAAVLVPVVALSGPGMHRGRGHDAGPGTMIAHATEMLGLSDAQVERLEALMPAHREEMKRTHEAMIEARRGLQTAVHAATIDEATIRTAVDAVGAAELKLALGRAELLQQMRAELTPEQREKMTEMISEHLEDGGPGRHAGFGRRHHGPGPRGDAGF